MYIPLFCYKQDSNYMYQRIGHSGREHIVNLSRNPKFNKKNLWHLFDNIYRYLVCLMLS